MTLISSTAIFAAALAAALVGSAPSRAQGNGGLLEGRAAFTDWHADRPGLRRHIRPSDLPAANLGASFSNGVRTVRRGDEKPAVPPGFEITLFAEGLDQPRIIRAAPNGDIFVAESAAGRIRVLRPEGLRPSDARARILCSCPGDGDVARGTAPA